MGSGQWGSTIRSRMRTRASSTRQRCTRPQVVRPSLSTEWVGSPRAASPRLDSTRCTKRAASSSRAESTSVSCETVRYERHALEAQADAQRPERLPQGHRHVEKDGEEEGDRQWRLHRGDEQRTPTQTLCASRTRCSVWYERSRRSRSSVCRASSSCACFPSACPSDLRTQDLRYTRTVHILCSLHSTSEHCTSENVRIQCPSPHTRRRLVSISYGTLLIVRLCYLKWFAITAVHQLQYLPDHHSSNWKLNFQSIYRLNVGYLSILTENTKQLSPINFQMNQIESPGSKPGTYEDRR